MMVHIQVEWHHEHAFHWFIRLIQNITFCNYECASIGEWLRFPALLFSHLLPCIPTGSVCCREPSSSCLTVGPNPSWCVAWWSADWGWSSCLLPPPPPPLISALQFTPDHQRLHFTQEFSIFYFLSPRAHPHRQDKWCPTTPWLATPKPGCDTTACLVFQSHFHDSVTMGVEGYSLSVGVTLGSRLKKPFYVK